MYVQLFLKLVLLYRLEKKFEKKKSVKWNFDDPSFIEALSSADKKQETKIIQSIKQIIGERKYLLRLIKKYASKTYIPGVCVCVYIYKNCRILFYLFNIYLKNGGN